MSDDVWMRCSACRRDLRFGATYQECSVSTCNRSRTRLVFCSVSCWDSHVAELRHREAWAVEARAPSRTSWEAERAAEAAAAPAAIAATPSAAAAAATRPVAVPEIRRQVVTAGPASSAPAAVAPGDPALVDGVERDMLIVMSKLKKYIRDRSGMNCSDAVADVLSDHVRALCDDSIRAAGRDGRKTVLDRDVPRPRR
ncbi:MAG: hypothetical protein KA297_27265 [Kofleriaceae bacterium]|nr:hypothetical protein [Kofleriaceae bacterium]MBP6837697.1 hypothetical protein [Kofleriaceae bacterium]